MAKQYKRPTSGSRGFKKRGDDLRVTIDRIRQANLIKVNALKEQERQQSEISRTQISGMSNQARNEAINRDILQRVDDKVHTVKRNAIALTQQREVENIRSQADEAGKQAQYWSDFASNYAKTYGAAAEGLIDFSLYKAAVMAYEKLSQEEKDNFKKFEHVAYKTVGDEAEHAVNKVVDLKEKRDIISQVSGLGNNHHLRRMLAGDFINTYPERLKWIKLNSYTKEGKNLYNKDNAAQLLLNDAYMYMRQFDIAFHSQAGQQILQLVKRNITAETIAYTNAATLQKNAADIQEALKVANAFFPTRNDSDENKAEWEDKLKKLEILVRGSAIEGDNNTVSLPNDANRKRWNEIDYWRVTIDHLVDNVDFADVTELEALNILTSKDGQPNLFDRFPDLRTHAETKLKEKLTAKGKIKKSRKELNFLKDINTQFLAPYNASVESGNFNDTVLNKEWREDAFHFLVNNRKLLTETNVAASEAGKSLMEIIMYNPADYGPTEGWSNTNFMLINNANEAMLAADPSLALFYVSQHDGELPAHFKGLHPAITAALKVPDFNASLDKFLIDVFKNELPYTPVPGDNQLPTALKHMTDVARGRFMQIWMTNSDIVDPYERFVQTQTQLKEEVQLGVTKNEGLFAAKQNKDPLDNVKYNFKILDVHGGQAFPTDLKNITSEINGDNGKTTGWYGSAATDENYQYSPVNSSLDYTGIQMTGVVDTPLPFDSEVDIEEGNEIEMDLPEIEGLEGFDIFTMPEEPVKDAQLYAFSFTEDARVQRNSRVRGIVDKNLGRIITESNALFLLDQVQRGKSDFRDLTSLPNLAEFIQETKKYYPNMDTKEIMDILFDSIYRNGDTVWKTPDDKGGKRGINDQFEGVTWPMDLTSFCRSLTGKACVKGEKNNFSSLLINELHRSGINVTELFRANILKGVK